MKTIILFFLFAIFSWALPATAESIHLEDLAKGSHGKVIFIRHAIAPGMGDPGNFTLGDCSTQRNLNEAGRRQARAIGQKIREAGIVIDKIYSSQWCRCLETAKLLNAGPVHPFSGLNSFYEQTEKEDAFLSELDKLIATFDKKRGLVIMVTHYVTIAAVTDKSTDSGSGVVLSLKDRSVKTIIDLN